MKFFLISCVIIAVIVLFFSSCQPKYEEKDGKIYYKWSNGGSMRTQYELVKNADTTSFEKLQESNKYCLGKDKNHVYKNSAVLKFADSKTFQQINDYYWKDKNYVYLLGGTGDDCRLIDADPKSFNFISDQWSKDNKNVFYGKNKVIEANAKSFVLLTHIGGKTTSFIIMEQ